MGPKLTAARAIMATECHKNGASPGKCSFAMNQAVGKFLLHDLQHSLQHFGLIVSLFIDFSLFMFCSLSHSRFMSFKLLTVTVSCLHLFLLCCRIGKWVEPGLTVTDEG